MAVTAEQKCYLCGASSFKERPGSVRDQKELKVLECLGCGLVFLSSFSHVTDSFYQESGMVNGNVDIKARLKDTDWDDERRHLFLRKMIVNKAILDFGCGNGGFLLRAKQNARSVAGVELETCFEQHYQENELQVYSSVDDINGEYDVITLFHVLEHLPDPCVILRKLADKLTPNGKIIMEVPNANDILLSLYNCEAFSHFTYWSCHLFLYNATTLELLAKKMGLKVDYVKQVQRYPLANHLHWLAKGKPGGHQVWSFLDSEELHHAYEKQLATIGCCDTIIASFSK